MENNREHQNTNSPKDFSLLLNNAENLKELDKSILDESARTIQRTYNKITGRILIVDDDDDNTCSLLKLIFKKAGYIANSAYTGKDAMDKLKERIYDIALLDIRLPDLDGIRLLKVMKELQPDLVMMIITGYASQESAIGALNMGASAYIVKPFDVQDVLIKIRDTLERLHLEKERRQLVNKLRDQLIERQSMEEALKQSEKRYRTLFEGMPIGLYRMTPGGKLLAANAEFIRMMGFSSLEEMRAINMNELSTKMDYPRQDFRELIERADEIRGFEQKLKRLDGSTVFIRENAKAIKDEQGSVLYYEGSFEDITKRKMAEEALKRTKDSLARKVEIATQNLTEEKQRIERIVETIPDGVVVFNTEGRVYYVNEIFKKFYKRIYNKELPPLLRDIPSIGHPFGEAIAKAFFSQKKEYKTIEPHPGLFLQLTSSMVLNPPNPPIGIVITVRDVTSLVELDRLREQFISMVSHELRTPITAIDLSIRNLQNYRDQLSAAQIDSIVDMVAESSTVLNQMIEDLLIVSRIESGELKLDVSTYALWDIISEVLIQLEPARLVKNITISTNIPPAVEIVGDSKRLGQMLRILMDNAIKYSAERTTVTIGAITDYQGKYNPKKLDGLLIQVNDAGIGISERDMPYIFDRFFRASNVKDVPGTGLGLSIAKELAAIQNGEVFVDSELGKGSTFSVFLPVLVN
ncbi:MAG: response regulator [Candidatus Thorarchaeota archaeon]